MKYWRITAETPYAGTDETEYLASEDMEEVHLFAEQFARDNAESYAYTHTGWNDDYEDEEDMEQYYSDCTFSIEEITKEEFDTKE